MSLTFQGVGQSVIALSFVGSMLRRPSVIIRPQVFDAGYLEKAFFWFKKQVVRAKAIENLDENVIVFFFSGCKHQDVVHVDDDMAAIDEVGKEVIHHCLEGGRGVSQSEEHDRRFEQPLVSLECRLPFVTFFDTDVIVPPSDVHFGKDASSTEFVE